MCFTKRDDYKIASSDIVCYKVMTFDRRASLCPLIWRSYKHYFVGNKIKAYKKLSSFKKRNADLINKLSSLNGEVVHSYTNIHEAIQQFWGHDSAIVECIIPKGEYYWENPIDGEYASLSVKISRILYFKTWELKSFDI